jgi:hypothetical protein
MKKYYFRPEMSASILLIRNEDGTFNFVFADGDLYKEKILNSDYPEKYGYYEVTKAEAEKHLINWGLFAQMGGML